MGGNKSKPFVDTASRVASKFKAPEIQQVASVAPTVVAAEAVSKKPIGIPPIGIRAPDFEVVSDYQATARIETVKNQSFPEATQQDDREMEMDPAILAEISKWQAVKASPKEVKYLFEPPLVEVCSCSTSLSCSNLHKLSMSVQPVQFAMKKTSSLKPVESMG
jgi:hypothetical protein